jgi:hypothetical protein
MIFLNIIHENELLWINLPTGDVERNQPGVSDDDH